MKTRTKPMFPRLRLLMMLFMLVSMVSSLSFTASAAQTNGIAGPTVELCLALDANDNMVLTDAEASALETDLNGDQVVNQADVNLLMRFCADVQSFSVAPIGDPGGAYGKIGICKATASATNPFVYIEVNGAATSEKNQELIDDFVDSFPNSFAAPPGVDSTEECNTYEPPWAGIVVQKFFCLDLECSLPFAEFQTSPIVSFAIYQGEDTTAQPLVTRDLVDLADGADGFTVELEGFGDGDVVTICETKVTGADTWATSIECQSRELYTGDYIEVEFYNFQNEEERPNLLVLEKYYCEGTDLEGPTTTAYLGGDEYDLDACEKGVAEFVIADDEGNPLDLDLSTLFTTGVELMPGAYGLWEVVGEELVLVVEFEIGGGETVSFTVLNPVEDAPTVDLHIYKEVCKDVDGFDEINPCVPSDAMDGHTLYFTVFALAGDVDDEQIGVIDVVEVELVIDEYLGSAAVEDLSLADFYAICEIVPDGIEGVYIYSLPGGMTFEDDELGACVVVAGEDLDEDLLIQVLFLNDVEEGKPPVKPEKPEKPVTPEKPVIPVPEKPAPTVTTLPSTGSGMADESSVAPWMLMTSAVALAGTGAILRKERPAA